MWKKSLKNFKYIAYNQIEKYEMETIEKKLGYTREMLVFLGILSLQIL